RRYIDPRWIVEEDDQSEIIVPATAQSRDVRYRASAFHWFEYPLSELASRAARAVVPLLCYSGEADEFLELATLEKRGNALHVCVGTEELDVGGSSAGEAAVSVTSLPSGEGAELFILHGPVAARRYALSIFCRTDGDA